MNHKISVIVPVYNTEDYLEECFDSISLQTYKNFEVILVNDGSTDKSGDICDLYSTRDKRFKVIHKSNEGVSIARNTALDIVTGDYICFVDSDDTIEKDMFEHFLHLINEYKVDIAISDGCISNKNTNITTPICLNQEQARNNFYKQKLIGASLCLCMFKVSLFKEIRFPSNIVMWEDFAIMACLLNIVKSVVITGKRFYNYRMRLDSATHKPISYKNMTCFDIDTFLYENEIYKDKQERINVISFFIKNACCESFRDINSLYTAEIRIKALSNIKSIILSNSISIKNKIIILIYILSPQLAMNISNKYNKIRL